MRYSPSIRNGSSGLGAYTLTSEYLFFCEIGKLTALLPLASCRQGAQASLSRLNIAGTGRRVELLW